jgi:hypothetical protein
MAILQNEISELRRRGRREFTVNRSGVKDGGDSIGKWTWVMS